MDSYTILTSKRQTLLELRIDGTMLEDIEEKFGVEFQTLDTLYLFHNLDNSYCQMTRLGVYCY